jgi:hypothetical protein
MGSYKHPRVFLPLDLQIVEMVYDAAWTQIVNNDPFRDTTYDEECKEALRKKVFALAQGSVDYDILLNTVMSNISETWAILAQPTPKGFPKPQAS